MPETASNKTASVSARISKETKKALSHAAIDADKTVGELIEELIEVYLDEGQAQPELPDAH